MNKIYIIRNMRLYLQKGVKGKQEREECVIKERNNEHMKEVEEVKEKDVKMDREGKGEKKKEMRRKRAIEKWIK